MIRRILGLGFLLLGAMTLARAADATEPAQTDAVPSQAESQVLTPYESALLSYKTGKYDEARTAIDAAEQARPGDLAVEILKSRILTEQHEYAEGEKLLRSLLTPEGPVEVQVALGDLLLRKHSFNRAAKYYNLALQAKPNDPDLTLKLVYASIGGADLVSAGQYASRLTPLDPKNPYDTNPSYYFAKAALARSTNDAQEEENEIQTARTFYGITVTNRYLKTYLDIFASNDKGANPDVTPPPLVKPAPSGVKQ